MSRGGGKVFEACPKCSKKGLYLSNGWPYWGDGTRCCRYCHLTLKPGATYVPKATFAPYATAYYDALDEALDTFQWAYQDREHNRGEFSLDRDTNKLILTIFVADTADESYDPAESPLLPLEGRFEVDMTKSPQEMIRAAIHAYVCHEADEQMWFDNERIFDPHKIDA